MSPENSQGAGVAYEGNPHFDNEAVEAPELAKAQLKAKIETSLDDIANAKERLEDAKTNETFNPEAAQELIDQLEAEHAALMQTWEEQYGSEEIE